MKNSTYRRRKNIVSTWKKSAAERIVFAWACRNARQVCSARLGARSMSASLRICHACAVPKLAPYSELAFPVPVRPPCKGGQIHDMEVLHRGRRALKPGKGQIQD